MSCDASSAAGKRQVAVGVHRTRNFSLTLAGHLTMFVVRPSQPVRRPNLLLNASLSAVKRLDRDVQPSQTSARIPARPSAQGRLICAP